MSSLGFYPKNYPIFSPKITFKKEKSFFRDFQKNTRKTQKNYIKMLLFTIGAPGFKIYCKFRKAELKYPKVR